MLNSKKCDFIVRLKDKTTQFVHVCWELTFENQEREINGLLEVMRFFKTKNGIIVSANSTDTIRTELGFISVIPVYEYLMT